MAFLRKHTYGREIVTTHIINNSATVQIGDVVQLRLGDADPGSTAGQAVFGVVIGLVDRFGNSVFGSNPVLGGATVTGSEFSGSVTVAADNETVDQIAVSVDSSKDSIYSADVDGTLGTNNNSDKPGGAFNQTDENSIDETTHSRTVTEVRTFFGWGEDPDDTTRVLVSIMQSEKDIRDTAA